jgi:hypothetical protein
MMSEVGPTWFKAQPIRHPRQDTQLHNTYPHKTITNTKFQPNGAREGLTGVPCILAESVKSSVFTECIHEVIHGSMIQQLDRWKATGIDLYVGMPFGTRCKPIGYIFTTKHIWWQTRICLKYLNGHILSTFYWIYPYNGVELWRHATIWIISQSWNKMAEILENKPILVVVYFRLICTLLELGKEFVI